MVIIKQKCLKSNDYWVNITLNHVQKLKIEKISDQFEQKFLWWSYPVNQTAGHFFYSGT